MIGLFRVIRRSPLLAVTTVAMAVASFQAGCLVVGIAPLLASFGSAASATGPAELTLLVAGFTFSIAGLGPLAGVLADHVAHRSLPLGLVLLAAGLLVFAADPATGAAGLWWAIIARLGAGVAAALVMTASTAAVLSSGQLKSRPEALAVNQTAWGGGYSAGVLIGGPLCAWNWRAVAAISIALAVASAAAAWRMLAKPESPRVTNARPGAVPAGVLHAAGFALLAGALLVLVSSLGEDSLSWSIMPPVLCVIAGAGVLAIAFARQSGRHLRPVASFRHGTLASLCASTARSGLPLLVAVLAQAVLLPLHQVSPRLIPVLAALLLAPYGVTQLVCTAAAGRLIGRHDAEQDDFAQVRRVRQMTAGAMAAAAAGFAILATLGPAAAWAPLAAVLVLLGWASGWFVTPNLFATMHDIRSDSYGQASGIRLAYSYVGVAASPLLFLGLLQTALGPPLVSATARTLTACGLSSSAARAAAGKIGPCEVADNLAGINPIASLCHHASDPVVFSRAAAARLLAGPAGSGELRACALAVVLCSVAAALAWLRPSHHPADIAAKAEQP
jgi:MFS family permease